MKETGAWSLDDATTQHQYSQHLAKYLAKKYFANQHVIDLGCGNGSYTNYFNSVGIETIGVDGTDFPGSGRRVWDLTIPFPDDYVDEKKQIICLEVSEHIPLKYEKIFLDNVIKFAKDIIVLSWAIPGQGGYGHVNEQPANYVIDRMKAYGFEIDQSSTVEARQEMINDRCWWFRNSLFIFRKHEK